MTNLINTLIKQLVYQPRQASPAELAQLQAGLGEVSFTPALLEVDEALWGGFWHFDVLSAGYRLPASELAFLRATRLDHSWPGETDLAQFLADLRQAIQNPQAGIWTLRLAEEPWAIFAAGANQALVTVAWYCATTGQLHAGYRTTPSELHLAKAPVQRPLDFIPVAPAKHLQPPEPGWLRTTVEQYHPVEETNLATRLDVEILRWRLGPE